MAHIYQVLPMGQTPFQVLDEASPQQCRGVGPFIILSYRYGKQGIQAFAGSHQAVSGRA